MRTRPRTRPVIVTGGGTAGHVLPALSIATALVDGGRDRSSVRYVGSARGIEVRLVPEEGFRLTVLGGRGIPRTVGLPALVAVLGIAGACLRALVLLWRWRPEAVVSVGGYAAVPCSLAAVCLGVPLVVVCFDAVPGAANRLVARFAKASAVALPGTPLPRAVLTGPPVRKAALDVERSDEGRARARSVLSIPNGRLVVALTGGSLGARRLNEAGRALAAHLATREDVVLYHVAGARDLPGLEADAELQALVAQREGLDYRLVGYEDHLAELFAAADLVIARAGASTVAELCAIGIGSILVPLRGAPSDHQRANAALLAGAGAAIVLEDDETTASRVVHLVDELLSDAPRRAALSSAAKRLGRRDGAAAIAALVEDVAARRQRAQDSR